MTPRVQGVLASAIFAILTGATFYVAKSRGVDIRAATMCASGLSAMLTATGSPPAADSAENWVAMILRELGRSQASGFILDAIKWTVVGSLFGIFVAALGCMLFSRLGWYEVKMRFAGGIRWTVFILITALTAVLLGFAGFWTGAVRGSERVLTKSQLATEVFPKIADGVADAMAWVQVHAASAGNTNAPAVSAKLDGFRAGDWELHCTRFLQELEQLKEEAITNAVAKLEQSTLERTPQLKGGLGEKLLRQFLGGLGRLLVEKKVTSELRGWGADQIYLALREQLAAEAAKAGHPDTMKRSELSQFIVREGIVPGIMKPIRSTARAQQFPLAALAGAVIVLPPLCVRLARTRFGRTRKTETEPAGAPPVIH